MATDRTLGRRELITKLLAGGLAAGTFALSGVKVAWANSQTAQSDVLTEDVTTIGELPKARTCAQYNTKRFECTKYRAYKNVTTACKARYSARCGTFTCH
ncbi:MAG: hypothetical protein NTY02_14070 [Acidobacteria bacterium]|nr:hypothetical protein [Acidobacteriota bacterium]